MRTLERYLKSMEIEEWRFSTTWGSVTLEPIELKFGMIDYIRHPTPHAKIGSHWKRRWGGGMGEVVTSRAFFLSFLSVS